MALSLRDYQMVVALADEVLASAPADLEARFNRANGLIGLKQYSDAIAALHGLLEQDPTNLAVSQNIGLCYFVQGQYEAARPYLEQTYAGGVRAPDLLRMLVSTLHHLGELEDAAQIADENTEAAQSSGMLAGVYALLYLDVEQPAKAARYAARALQESPDSVDGLVVQGTLRTGRLDTERAASQFRRTLEVAPNNGRALVGLGMVSLLNQDLVAGRQWLERAASEMADHSGTWVALGWIQLLQGDLDEAETSFRRVIDLDGSFAEGHGGLASVLALRGDKAGAERLIEIADRLDSAGLSAKFARSVLIRGAGDPQGASNLLLQTLAGLSPGDNGPLSQLIARITRR